MAMKKGNTQNNPQFGCLAFVHGLDTFNFPEVCKLGQHVPYFSRMYVQIALYVALSFSSAIYFKSASC